MANQQETTPTPVVPDEAIEYLSERFRKLTQSIDAATDSAIKRNFRQEKDAVAHAICTYWLGAQLNAVMQALVEATDDVEGDGD